MSQMPTYEHENFTFPNYNTKIALNKKSNKIRTGIVIISIAVFITSLTQTAITYYDFEAQKTHSSISLFLMGGLSILGGGLWEWLIWLANPIYFLAVIFFLKSNKTSRIASISATILALSFTTWNEILVAENGRTATIKSLNSGYWLWLLSFILLSIGTMYYFKRTMSSSFKEE